MKRVLMKSPEDGGIHIKCYIVALRTSSVLYLICLTILYSKYIGTTGIETREYRVESSVLTSNFSGLKIIHFSDLLYGSITDKEDIKKMVDKMNVLKPDLVLFTGDLISPNYKLKENDKKEIIKQLNKLEPTIGKYAIYGDNDFDLNAYEDIITTSGFKLLNNEYEEIYYKTNESMYIVGLPSSIKSNIEMTKSFEFYSDENRKYTIVMTHEGKSIKYILLLIACSILLFVVGDLLGKTLEVLCYRFKIPEIIIGLLLGFITSIPELITFFESQKHHKELENEEEGVIEATNNLFISNIEESNISIVTSSGKEGIFGALLLNIVLIIFAFSLTNSTK